MNAFSSISLVKLDRSVHFYWFVFLLCFFAAVPFIKFGFSIYNEMWSRIEYFGKMQSDIDKAALSCDYYLKFYNDQYSQVTDADTKFQLSEKIAEYENLKAQNDLERNYYQNQMTDFNEGLKVTFNRILLFVLATWVFVSLAFLSLLHVLILQYANSKIYSRCQSCGRMQNSVLMNFGTERDGTHSRSFCNQCYATGKFINPNMTLEDMQIQVRLEMEEKNLPAKIIDRNCRTMKNLKRWKYARSY